MAYWHKKMDASGVDSGYPDWERLESVVAETGKTVDWLVSSGVEFSAEPYAASSSYPMALANGCGCPCKVRYSLRKMLERFFKNGEPLFSVGM